MSEREAWKMSPEGIFDVVVKYPLNFDRGPNVAVKSMDTQRQAIADAAAVKAREETLNVILAIMSEESTHTKQADKLAVADFIVRITHKIVALKAGRMP